MTDEPKQGLAEAGEPTQKIGNNNEKKEKQAMQGQGSKLEGGALKDLPPEAEVGAPVVATYHPGSPVHSKLMSGVSSANLDAFTGTLSQIKDKEVHSGRIEVDNGVGIPGAAQNAFKGLNPAARQNVLDLMNKSLESGEADQEQRLAPAGKKPDRGHKVPGRL
jgi:hypothetical protein